MRLGREMASSVGPLHRADLAKFVELCQKTSTLEIFNQYYRDEIFKGGDIEEGIAMAQIHEKAVGALYVSRDKDSATDQPLISVWGLGWSPWVDSEYHDRGVEDALTRYVADLCRAWQLTKVYITSWTRILQRGHFQMLSYFLINGFTSNWSRLELRKVIGDNDKQLETSLSFKTIDEVGSSVFLNLMNECFQGTLERWYTADILARESPKWIKEETYEQSLWLVGYLNNDLVGACVASLKPNPNIDFIGILPMYRRKGYGTQLVKKMIATIAQKGVMKVFIGIDEINLPAVRFFENLGFHINRIFESLSL